MAAHYAVASYKRGETWQESDGQLVDRTGMRLRLQALTAIGYSARELAEHTGLTVSYIQNLRTDSMHGRVGVETVRIVSRVYDELWDKPPTGVDADRQRTRARYYGYKLPMDLDDDAMDNKRITNNSNKYYTNTDTILPKEIDGSVVNDLLAGLKPAANRAELSHAARTLTDMGHTSKAIAERLGVTQRTVVRYRARMRSEAAA